MISWYIQLRVLHWLDHFGLSSSGWVRESSTYHTSVVIDLHTVDVSVGVVWDLYFYLLILWHCFRMGKWFIIWLFVLLPLDCSWQLIVTHRLSLTCVRHCCRLTRQTEQKIKTLKQVHSNKQRSLTTKHCLVYAMHLYKELYSHSLHRVTW